MDRRRFLWSPRTARERYHEHGGSRFDAFPEDDEDDKQERVDVEATKRRSVIGDALRLVEPWDDAGVTHQRAANAVDYSKGWVTNRVSEW